MTLKTQMQADLASVFYNTDDFAETVTYTPAGGAGISVVAIIDYGRDDEDGADDLGQNAKIRIMVSSVATVTAGDTITIGANTWEVHYARLSEDGLEWIADISKRSD